jgi:hypothetical protein
MNYHVLNGDALAEKFPSQLSGERIIWREAFIEGYQQIDIDDNFWQKRAAFVVEAYGATLEEYSQKFLSQLKLLMQIKDDDDVYLWFEDDLFCQINMWWVIQSLWRFRQPQKKPLPRLYRVFPEDKPGSWDGFGKATSEELVKLFQQAVPFEKTDVDIALKLWNAYNRGLTLELDYTDFVNNTCYRYLYEVMQAQNDRNPISGPGRPERILENIIHEGKESFQEIFAEFYKRAGIYGFGDVQVLRILHRMGPAYSR